MMITSKDVMLPVPQASDMRLYVAQPEGEPIGALIILPEAYGVNGYIRSVVDRFANEGYLAVAPELFHRTAPVGFESSYLDFEAVRPHFSAITVEGIETDVRTVYEWIRSHVDEELKVATVGFCMGGRASFIANGILPLSAAVSFYGGGIANHLDRVPQLHAPMLFLWGGVDTHIDAAQRRAVADAMVEHKKNSVDVVFSEAGHGFFCDARPSYHAPSSAFAWPMILEFLRQHRER